MNQPSLKIWKHVNIVICPNNTHVLSGGFPSVNHLFNEFRKKYSLETTFEQLLLEKINIDSVTAVTELKKCPNILRHYSFSLHNSQLFHKLSWPYIYYYSELRCIHLNSFKKRIISILKYILTESYLDTSSLKTRIKRGYFQKLGTASLQSQWLPPLP